MNQRHLVRLVTGNALRSRRHFTLSAFGIVIGISSFVFFLGLSMGVYRVLDQIFPLDQVEVIAARASLTGLATREIDDDVVARIRARPEVRAAVPRMTINFPAAGVGYLNTNKINFEVGGFCDGVDPSFIQDEEFADLFQDWESPEKQAEQLPCGPAPGFSCADPSRYYCDKGNQDPHTGEWVGGDRKCHHRVPVLISRTLLELYNSQFAKSHNLPAIGSWVEFMITRGGLGKMRFHIRLGDTMVYGSNRGIDVSRRRAVEGVLIGISDKAMRIGMTVPIQYTRSWNREFAGEEAAGAYSSVVVKLRNKQDLATFSQWLADELDLRLEDSLGQNFATAILIVTLLLLLISFVIVGISAINIAHNFFMQVSERRREIGILRAVGATRADIRHVIIGEAALIGLAGGVIGVALALFGGWVLDTMSGLWLPNFPFKPTSYFDFEWWIVVLGLFFSVLFCIVGGFLPARKAAKMEPAQALAQH